MAKLLDALRSYLRNTTEEELQDNWEQLKKWNKVGVSARQYIETCLANVSCPSIVFNHINEGSEYSLNFSF